MSTYEEFLQALKKAGAEYCATCNAFLYPDHRHAAAANDAKEATS